MATGSNQNYRVQVLPGFNETVSGLTGAGYVAPGSGTLRLKQDIDTTFSGMMDGTGGLTKNSNGTLTLSGARSYSGETNVNGGALVQGAAGTFSGASTYLVANNALIELGGYDTTMADSPMTAPSTLAAQAAPRSTLPATMTVRAARRSSTAC